ncbi:MAG: hypothetical protein PHX12_06050 [Proteiniphilum sp.]|nr:hypothetical protein [Proteiniphilum sp.]
MTKFNTRALNIGVGLRHVDAANIADTSLAHDFATSLENISADDMLVAIMDAGGGFVDKDGVIHEMTLSLHQLAAGEKAPNMACWKAFVLGDATTITPSENGAITAAFTPAVVNQLTVVGVNLSVPCSIGITGGGTAAIVNNTKLAATIPAGITYFMVSTTTTAACTLTFTEIGDDAPAYLLNGTTAVAYPVTPLTMGKLNLIY